MNERNNSAPKQWTWVVDTAVPEALVAEIRFTRLEHGDIWTDTKKPGNLLTFDAVIAIVARKHVHHVKSNIVHVMGEADTRSGIQWSVIDTDQLYMIMPINRRIK